MSFAEITVGVNGSTDSGDTHTLSTTGLPQFGTWPSGTSASVSLAPGQNAAWGYDGGSAIYPMTGTLTYPYLGKTLTGGYTVSAPDGMGNCTLTLTGDCELIS